MDSSASSARSDFFWHRKLLKSRNLVFSSVGSVPLAASPVVRLGIGMKKPIIARNIARQGGMSRAEAADQLDHVVSEILASLKRGKPAELPGLGSFRQASGGRIRFQREEEPRG